MRLSYSKVPVVFFLETARRIRKLDGDAFQNEASYYIENGMDI